MFRALYSVKFPEDISFLYEHVENENENGTLYLWESVKWYLSDPEVSFIQSFLNSLDWEDFCFVCIGEESDDNEHSGCSDLFGLRINRSIGWY